MIMKLKKKSLGIGTLKYLRVVFTGTVELFLTLWGRSDITE